MSTFCLYQLLFGLSLFYVVAAAPDELPRADECGTVNTDYYFNQKRITEIDEFPWMARILYRNNTDQSLWFRCYAVLISKRFLIVRASCFNFEDEPIRIELGDWNLSNAKTKSDCDDNGRCAPVPIEIDIEEIINHPNYDTKTNANAIALVKMVRPVAYSDFIRPICLPNRDVVQMNFNNDLLEVTGWYFNSSIGQTLAKSFARVVNLKTCEAKMKHFTLDTKTNICAYTCYEKFVYSLGTILTDIRTVDGEPSYYYLIGINLHGLEVCSLLYPDVYLRVDRYLDWIYANLL